jgi:hypothetical protein
MQSMLGLFFLCHGFAHLAFYRGGDSHQRINPSRFTLLSGKLRPGRGAFILYRWSWPLVTGAYWVSALGYLTERPWAVPLALGATLVSILSCIFGLPETRIGIFLNLLLLAMLTSVTPVSNGVAGKSVLDQFEVLLFWRDPSRAVTP